jgi:hypothetical protein
MHNNDHQHIFLGGMLADFYHEIGVATITLKIWGFFKRKIITWLKSLASLFGKTNNIL